MIVVLNSWSGNFNILVMSDSDVFLFPNFILFSLFLPSEIYLFLIAGNNVPGKRNSCNEAFSNMMVRCRRRGSIPIVL